jgi:hypothetical protein
MLVAITVKGGSSTYVNYSCKVLVGVSIEHILLYCYRSRKFGSDWFSSYIKRHPTLKQLVGHGAHVSTEHVEEFFSKLGEVINNYSFDGNDIWNVDETGTTKMQTSDKVDAKRDTKPFGAITSAERGILVSMACA